MQDAQRQVKLSPREARQGRLGWPVLVVLVVSLSLGLLVLGGLVLGVI